MIDAKQAADIIYGPDDDLAAAQHADALALQRQTLEDLYRFYIDGRSVTCDVWMFLVEERAERIAAALGFSAEWQKRIEAGGQKQVLDDLYELWTDAQASSIGARLGRSDAETDARVERIAADLGLSSEWKNRIEDRNMTDTEKTNEAPEGPSASKAPLGCWKLSLDDKRTITAWDLGGGSFAFKFQNEDNTTTIRLSREAVNAMKALMLCKLNGIDA